MKYPRTFKAIFCPRCGECVNEPAEILGAHSAEAVNCFWCKRRHSIDQVKVCRQLAHLSERQQMAGARAGLLRMQARLTKEPSMDFMKGYTRPPEMVNELVEALRVALHANSAQRMGQLLSNLTRNSEHDLFNVYDEDMARLLRAET